MAKNGFSMSNRLAVETISANKTITQNDCGKVFVMASASAAYTITLPSAVSAEAGWNCTFVVGNTAKAHVITGSQDAAANIYALGMGSEDGTAFPASLGSADSKLTFDANEMLVGDQILFETDGTEWYARIMTAAAGTITLA